MGWHTNGCEGLQKIGARAFYIPVFSIDYQFEKNSVR